MIAGSEGGSGECQLVSGPGQNGELVTVPRLGLQIGGDREGHETCGHDDSTGAESKLPTTTTHWR